MHIAIVSQYFYPENFRINDLAVALVDQGHKVTVLTGAPNYPEGRFYEGYKPSFKRDSYKGVEIIRVPITARGKKSKALLALNYLSFPMMASLAIPFLKLSKVDQIFIYGASPIFSAIPGLVLKFLTRAKATLWVQDLWPESLSATQMIKNRTIIAMVGFCTRLIYAGMDQIYITSRGFEASIRSYDTTQTPIHFFPQWGETIFEEQKIKDDFNAVDILPQGFKVIFAGNIGVAQSLGIVIEAGEVLKDYEDINFVLIGNGRDKERLKSLVQSKNLEHKIHFVDSYSLDYMPNFFSLADILFLSLDRDPIFSMTVPGKVQAYMASEKPIVTAVDGEASRLIDEAKCGLSGASGDALAFAQNILKIYQLSAEERNALARNARSFYMENFQRSMLIGKINKSFRANNFYY